MKKIVSIGFLLVLVLALAVPAFASSVLPPLPQQAFEAWTIADIDGQVAAVHYTTSTLTDEKIVFRFCRLYFLEDDEWVFFGQENDLQWDSSMFQYIMYDTLGRFPNKVNFLVTSNQFEDIKAGLLSQFRVDNVVAVLVVGVGAVVGLVFMWWGVRKLTRAVFSAFRKGKISV